MRDAISLWLTRQLPPSLFTGELPKARGYLHALKLLSPAIDNELIERECEWVKDKAKTRRHKQTGYEFKVHEYTGKRYSGGYSIELDPSKFPSLKECIDFAEILIPKSWATAGGIRVARIDYAVEIDSELVPPHLFRWTMRVSGKRIDDRYRSTKFEARSGLLSGGELGKSPHKVMYYDVDARHRKRKNDPHVKRTKIEIQVSQKSNQLPLENLQELKKRILSINPFKRIEFLDSIRPRYIERMTESKQARIQDFRMRCISECGHTARVYMYKLLHRNFDRYFSPKIDGKDRAIFPQLRIGRDKVLFKEFLYQTLQRDLQDWLGK